MNEHVPMQLMKAVWENLASSGLAILPTWIIPVFFCIIPALCLLLRYPCYSGNCASIIHSSLQVTWVKYFNGDQFLKNKFHINQKIDLGENFEKKRSVMTDHWYAIKVACNSTLDCRTV